MKAFMIGGISVLLGGGIGFFLGYRKGAMDTLKELEQKIDEVSDKYKRKKREEKKEEVPFDEDTTGVDTKTEGSGFSKVETKPVNYQEKYEAPENEEDDIMTKEEEWTEAHQKEMNDKIRIISYEDSTELPEYYEKEILYYFQHDDVLTEEDTKIVIPDEELLVGDALDKYEFRENDEQVIFVRNPELAICYEVQKVQGAWSDMLEEE